MTPSDLDEIRKLRDALRDPAALKGPNEVAVAGARLGSYASALLDEVERLQRERDAAWRQHDFVTEREKQLVANLERADARLALLEPVWEAARAVHRIFESAAGARRVGAANAICELVAAVDAAVAKEGK